MERKTWITDGTNNVWASASAYNTGTTYDAFDIKLSPLEKFAQMYFRQPEFNGWLVEDWVREEHMFGYRFKLSAPRTGAVQYVMVTDQEVSMWMENPGDPRPRPKEPNTQGVIDFLADRARGLIA